MSTSTTTASNVSPPKPASTPSSSTSAQVTIPEIPDGYTIFTENTASILLPSTDEAFLNPVQEFNRDMSVACIRVWSDELNQAKEERWKRVNEGGVKMKGKGKKKLKTEGAESLEKKGEEADVETKDQSEVSTAPINPYSPYRFTLLEALSATGLRAIRYAKEIPLVRYVIANDLSSGAVEAIKRNVELNNLSEEDAPSLEKSDFREGKDFKAKVRINEGDACALMYSHRSDRSRVDCVDLDPYGTAAPFIDGAVQCVNDGGLLCVTCTDMQVLATNNYPEKCYSNYGGIPVKAEYCHEAALRLVLHTISTSAARYGRYIEPLLSLSIDFYVRLFIRVHSGAANVKKTASQNSIFYICSGCQAFYEQPLGKVVEKVSDKTGQTNLLYRQQTGPPVDGKCPECDSALHLSGPMWNGPMHNSEFASKVLNHVEENYANYGTWNRMKGMLTLAKEELHTPFYFTPGRVSGLFHCVSPSLEEISNALFHAGFSVSRSHTIAGSLKTNATRQDIHDVIRNWVKENPVKPESISENSPAKKLLSKTPRFEANFDTHPSAVALSSKKVSLVRYQMNPTPNWGPGKRATGKRKREINAEEGSSAA